MDYTYEIMVRPYERGEGEVLEADIGFVALGKMEMIRIRGYILEAIDEQEVLDQAEEVSDKAYRMADALVGEGDMDEFDGNIFILDSVKLGDQVSKETEGKYILQKALHDIRSPLHKLGVGAVVLKESDIYEIETREEREELIGDIMRLGYEPLEEEGEDTIFSSNLDWDIGEFYDFL